ncbi:MAG TPA: hypothetical protein VMK05_14050 [Burkholderiales bacterium]|nr:hypothetical protein [Burkholderiales bacterium]
MEPPMHADEEAICREGSKGRKGTQRQGGILVFPSFPSRTLRFMVVAFPAFIRGSLLRMNRIST